MGNAATCSLVDVVGTVTVTQTDGQRLEFVQPIFASQVKKLHPGSWLLYYQPDDNRASGQQQQCKMCVLQDNEELLAGEFYVLLPGPSHVRKPFPGPSNQRSSTKSGVAGVGSCPSRPRQAGFSGAGSPVRRQRPHRRCSNRQKFHTFDWRPTLMTIQEAF